MTSSTTLYIARHGETTMNAAKITMGQMNSPLTAKGVEQARLLHDELADITFDAIYCSDLQRCVDTAEIILGNTTLTIRKLPSLRERDFGSFEGKPGQLYAAVRESKLGDYQRLSKEERPRFKFAPDVESDAEMTKRVFEGLHKIVRDNHNKKVLIITHSGPVRMLLIRLGYFTDDQLPAGSFKHGQYFVLESRADAFKLVGIFPDDIANIVQTSE